MDLSMGPGALGTRAYGRKYRVVWARLERAPTEIV